MARNGMSQRSAGGKLRDAKLRMIIRRSVVVATGGWGNAHASTHQVWGGGVRAIEDAENNNKVVRHTVRAGRAAFILAVS